MCSVKLHIFCYKFLLSSTDSKLAILIYTGVRYPEQSLIGVRLEVLKGLVSCYEKITAHLRLEFRFSRILKCVLLSLYEAIYLIIKK
jgi:hypothetical protein